MNKQSAENLPGPGPGRPKGSVTDVKAFSSLLGKVLPMQVTGEDGGAVIVEIRRFAHESRTD